MHQLPVTAESRQGPNAMNSYNDTLANIALTRMLTTIFPVSFVRTPTSTVFANLAQKEHMVKQRRLSSFTKHKPFMFRPLLNTELPHNQNAVGPGQKYMYPFDSLIPRLYH